MDSFEVAVSDSINKIAQELETVLSHGLRSNLRELVTVAGLIARAPRIFLVGAGRSGIALRMTAMRLMHLGHTVHVVGEVTTPAIARGDLLLAASGSGTTPGVVRAATTAVSVGARVAAITTALDSPLAHVSTATIPIPAPEKLDRGQSASQQYAGSLFEQTVVILGDALFHALWRRTGQSADQLWPRHANLE